MENYITLNNEYYFASVKLAKARGVRTIHQSSHNTPRAQKPLKTPSIIFNFFFFRLIWGWLYNYRKRYLKLNCSVRHYCGILLIFAIYKNISKFIIVFCGAFKLHRAVRIITKPLGQWQAFIWNVSLDVWVTFYFR